MSNTTLSPNMNLPVPIVGVEPGPDYASDINVSLGIIDQHTHISGSGVPITPDAININAALTFNNQFATNLAGLTLLSQSSPPDINTVYQVSGDLYFVDGVGNNVRITQSGAVAGTPGSIANLVPPATASYSAGSSTFVWQSNTSVAANMDFGAAILRNISPNSTYALTLRPPAALGSNYTLTLPAVPGAQSFMTLDTSGNMSTSVAVANGLTGANIANNTLSQTQITTGFRQMHSQVFTSSGTFTAPSDTSADTIFKITVIGAGGSGATSGGSGGGGGGGGAGGTAIAWITGVDIPPSSSHVVTVGIGGTAISASNTNGNAGTSSSFGAFAVATGGGAGQNTIALNIGGNEGFGTVGDLIIGGQGGNNGTLRSGATIGGTGGSSSMGGGGRGSASGNTGHSGSIGGGGGGTFVGISGAGGAGLVMIEWLQ